MSSDKITTALLLAAGMGSRLRPLTVDAPKCLTVVGGKSILGRLIENLRYQGITRLVVVTGHLDSRIREFLNDNAPDFQLHFVFNPIYQTTNNIYSLWLARKQIQEPFLLLESDLVFDPSMLDYMLDPNKIAISRILPWMNGTTVELDDHKGVLSFHVGHDVEDKPRYKTVNIYSLCLPSWRKVVTRLDRYISSKRLGEYYEVVFEEMVADGSLGFDAVFFADNRWYEIDTMENLHQADKMYKTIQAVPLTPLLDNAFRATSES